MEVTSGYKQTDLGLIPEDWDVKLLGELGEALIGLTYKPSDVRSDGVLVLRSSNIHESRLRFDDNVFVEKEIPERLRVRNGDILICVRNGSRELIGKSAYIDESALGATFGAFMTVFRSPYQTFIFHQFQSSVVKNQINKHLGATINQITNKSLNSFSIPFPQVIAEQDSIAEVLSDADSLIEATDKLLIKNRAIKQAVMQELLTGKKRLATYDKKWNVCKIGEIAEIKKGQLITKKDAIKGNIPVIAGGKQPAYYHNTPNRFGKTITISGSGANAGYVGFFDVPIFASDCSTIEEGKTYIIEFIYQQLLLRQGKIYKSQTGGAQPHIHPKDIATLEIGLPEKQEQRAIAKMLSDIDSVIIALEEKLDKIRNLKQGMMQELLTGRIRLL